MRKKQVPEQHNDFEDAFIREIDEELKNEKLKRIWDKYGLLIIIFVTLAVFAAVSFETFKAWQDRRNQEMSNTFAYALNLQNQGRFAEADEVLTSLVDADKGVYSNIAEMQKVNLLLEQNQTEKALSLLQDICNNEDFNPQIRDVALIKLASYKLENAPAQEIKDLLTPLLEQQSLWNLTAKELLAMLAVREKDYSQAIDLYQEISSAPKAPETMKARAVDMINVLNN